MMLLPPSLESLIAPNHPVRIVNQVIDSVDISPIVSKLSGGGASVYHPKMLLKVLIYGYMTNVYSSRKLEAAIKTEVTNQLNNAKAEAEARARAEADRLKAEAEARAKAEADRLKNDAKKKAEEELNKLKGRFKF